MVQVCLDSEVTLEFLKGEHTVIEKLRHYADNDDICITSLSLLQLINGINKLELIEPFIDTVSILNFDKKSANTATKLIKELRENNIRKSMDTIFTASVCMAHDACLFTSDRKKYEGIKGLKLI